jgi:hypothetical protein
MNCEMQLKTRPNSGGTRINSSRLEQVNSERNKAQEHEADNKMAFRSVVFTEK